MKIIFIAAGLSAIVGVVIGYKVASIGKVEVVRCKNCYSRTYCQIFAQCMEDGESYCSLGTGE